MELKFNFAKITQSRLMGSMGMIIDSTDENGDNVKQYFLLDSEGLGLCDYVKLINPSEKKAYMEEERLMGGLGSDRIEISEEEAKFLIQHFGSRNIRYGKELAGEVEDYIDIINDFKSDLNIYDLYPKICKEVKEEIEFVNYMVMRLVAWDREALTYYSERDRDYINGLLKVNYKGLEYQDSMFFEQNALYDFVESGNDDFYDFLDEE